MKQAFVILFVDGFRLPCVLCVLPCVRVCFCFSCFFFSCRQIYTSCSVITTPPFLFFLLLGDLISEHVLPINTQGESDFTAAKNIRCPRHSQYRSWFKSFNRIRRRSRLSRDKRTERKSATAAPKPPRKCPTNQHATAERPLNTPRLWL